MKIMGGNTQVLDDLGFADFCKFPDLNSYKPIFFDGKNSKDLGALVREKRPVLHDEIAGQIKELYKIRNPHRKFTAVELSEYYDEWLKENDPSTYGCYFFYPWSNILVHLVGEKEFVELRTSRNKHKIKQEEQDELSTKTIGVIGLSVGQSVALALAMERSCGTIRLADFDTLELTNLNRIRAGVASLGLPKTVVVAREIAEIDPFIKVELYSEGITKDNIDPFLEEGGKLDVLLEECDSLNIKILSRLKARALGIPVVMDTSDRGMVDVERFDLDKNLPLLHGKCAVTSMEEFEKMTPEEQMQLMMAIVDFDKLSDRMKFSFGELGKSLSTWPQLATDVISGGGNAAKVARMIVLGEDVPSKRYYFDVSDHIKNSNG